MPKIFIHAPENTFDAAARQRVAADLTELALECEKIPKSPFAKSNAWIYFNQYAADEVFMAGRPAYRNIVSIQFYTIEHGLDDASIARLREGATEILGRHGKSDGVLPVHMVFLAIPARNWGSFGKPADLAALRNSAPDAPSI